MKISGYILTAALGLATGGAQAANLVVNGSFEDPLQAAGTFGIFASVPGWSGDPDIEIRNDYEGVAQDGLNFVELDTFGNSRMSQTIVGTGRVILSFWFAARGTPSVPAGSNTLGFSLGDLSGVLLADAPGVAAHDWQFFTGIANLGSTGSAVLSFEALGISDQLGGSLDNISVTPVPAPGALALLLSGIGVLRLRARRAA